MRILAVCSGNICRSPMAEGILRALLEQRGLSHRVSVASAGTLGILDHPPHPHAIRACAALGVDIARQRSRALDVEELRVASHVACMEEEHAEAARDLAALLPERERPEVFLLGAWDDPARPGIDDPLGSDLAAFEATRDRILRASRAFLDRLLERDP